MIKNWLSSVSFEHALKLVSIYPRWTDKFAVSSGFPLQILISQHVKLWTDYTMAQKKALIKARGTDAEKEINRNANLQRFAESITEESRNILPNMPKRVSLISE
jgi:hypothetical protein